jgi:hypothetical protein
MRVKSKSRRWNNNPAVRRSDSDDDYDEVLVPDQQMPVEPEDAAIPVKRDQDHQPAREVTNAEVEAAFTLSYKERRSGKSAGHKDAVYKHKVTGHKLRSLPEAKRYLAAAVEDVPAPHRQRKVNQPAAPWVSLCLCSSSSESG